MKTNNKDIIKKLEPYVSDRRRGRIDSVIASRLDSIHLAIESPADINNALAAIRTAEALGISTVHIITPESSATIARTITQGSHYWITILFHDNLTDFISYLHKENRLLVGGCVQATDSLATVSIEQPLCVVVGNEQRGLSESLQAACDLTYKIPIYGMSESYNVSVSAAISLYELSQRKRAGLATLGDLSEQQQLAVRAEYYRHSVSARLVDALLSE